MRSLIINVPQILLLSGHAVYMATVVTLLSRVYAQQCADSFQTLERSALKMTLSEQTLQRSYLYGSSPLPSGDRKPHKIYLFGYPISHSKAPLLHSTIWKQLGVPWTYNLVESLETTDFLPLLKSSDCMGAAVTMPHKVSILIELDELTDEARMIGAVNTIFIRTDDSGRRKYIGTNTDCEGIRKALVESHPQITQETDGNAALIIGGGGACRSAIYSLVCFLGIKEIYLVNRLDSEVQEIISSMQKAGLPATLIHVMTVEEARSWKSPVTIIGTVPDTPPKSPGEVLAKEIVLEFLKKQKKGCVLDMCYYPHPHTTFLKLSQQHGWKICTGTEVLIHQGIAQDALWLETPVEQLPTIEAEKNVREALNADITQH